MFGLGTSINMFIYTLIACSIAINMVYAIEIDLNEQYTFVSNLPVNTIHISSKTSYNYSNPNGTLVTGNVTVTSPQMKGLLKILYVDPNFSLPDKEKQSLANNILDELRSNLTENGLEFGSHNSDNVVMINDRSGRYVGSAFWQWTQEGIFNLFALLEYGSKRETEKQIKAMKIVREGRPTSPGIPITPP